MGARRTTSSRVACLPGRVLALARPTLALARLATLALAALALALVALVPFAGPLAAESQAAAGPAHAVGSAHVAAPRTSLPAVESEVMCVTCKIPLNVAQSSQASRERVYIQSLIDEGRTLPEIKRALVFQYGSAVLALPPDHGFDVGVYVVPVAVLVALLVTVALLLPRWRRRARATQAAREAEQVPAPGTLSASDAARLQADMARFD
jgi:cytochrome c-type biogenesis protein CcmH